MNRTDLILEFKSLI